MPELSENAPKKRPLNQGYLEMSMNLLCGILYVEAKGHYIYIQNVISRHLQRNQRFGTGFCTSFFTVPTYRVASRSGATGKLDPEQNKNSFYEIRQLSGGPTPSIRQHSGI